MTSDSQLRTVERPHVSMEGTTKQASRLAEAFRSSGYNVDLVPDAAGRPLVVRLVGAFDAAKLAPIVHEAARRWDDDPPDTSDLATVPNGNHSGCVYPPDVTAVLDIAVRAATENAEVAATRLFGSEVRTTSGVGDSPAHTDFAGNFDDPPLEHLHGMNVHCTTMGSGSARFSQMPTPESVRAMASNLRRAKAAGRTQKEKNEAFNELYRVHMQRATEPVHVGAGDVLIFQARPHFRKHLLPTVHQFATTSPERWHTLFIPGAGHAEKVRAKRRSLQMSVRR